MTTAKKSTLGSLKRSLQRTHDKQQDVAKHPRITIDDDGKTWAGRELKILTSWSSPLIKVFIITPK